jgi:predicted RNase H-like HicB family nuclease
MKTFTAYIERDPDTGWFFGMIPSVPGAYTQGETLDELHKNLKEVLELCLEELEEPIEDLAEFIGIQQITIGA